MSKNSKIGLILKEKRENLGFTIEEVERRLNISKRFIVAIENDDISIFPRISYASPIIRTYARFLGFSDSEVANLVRKFNPKEIKPKFVFINLTYIIILLILVIACLIALAL